MSASLTSPFFLLAGQRRQTVNDAQHVRRDPRSALQEREERQLLQGTAQQSYTCVQPQPCQSPVWWKPVKFLDKETWVGGE